MPSKYQATRFIWHPWSCNKLDEALTRVNLPRTYRGIECGSASYTAASAPHAPEITQQQDLNSGDNHGILRTQEKSFISSQLIPSAVTYESGISTRGYEGRNVENTVTSESPLAHLHLRGRIVRAVRPDGATIRNALDIDNSNPVGRYDLTAKWIGILNITVSRLPTGGLFVVHTTAVLPPPDDDCVAVVRLGGYPVEACVGDRHHIGGDLLWISLTGRAISDHLPIVELVST